jgi:hypothetical protein
MEHPFGVTRSYQAMEILSCIEGEYDWQWTFGIGKY